MLDKFSQFYRLNEAQLKQLWTDAIFVFDTNVLFNLYRYSNETTKEFLQAVQNIKDRAWLPYQVGLEFHRSRIPIINNEINIHNKFIEKIDALCMEIENKSKNPFISSELNSQLLLLQTKIKNELTAKIKEFKQRISEDDILRELDDIFNGKVGDEFSKEKLDSICKDGELRYKEDIPPGYGDKKKPIPERYGDLIIWYEILEKSKKSSKPMLFITDDGKEDWWLLNLGETISPRPELIKEFKISTGQLCHFYKPFQFLKYSNEFQGSHIKVEIIEEVKKLERINHNVNENIILKLKFRSLTDKNDFNRLIDLIKQDGYQVILESETMSNTWLVLVTLPNIADLERRFTKKYLTDLRVFNVELIDNQKYVSP